MKTNCGVYQIVHKPTGKIYIGASRQLDKREKHHFIGGIWTGQWRCDQIKGSVKSNYHFGILEYCSSRISIKRFRKKEYEWMDIIHKIYPELLLSRERQIHKRVKS